MNLDQPVNRMGPSQPTAPNGGSIPDLQTRTGGVSLKERMAALSGQRITPGTVPGPIAHSPMTQVNPQVKYAENHNQQPQQQFVALWQATGFEPSRMQPDRPVTSPFVSPASSPPTSPFGSPATSPPTSPRSAQTFDSASSPSSPRSLPSPSPTSSPRGSPPWVTPHAATPPLVSPRATPTSTPRSGAATTAAQTTFSPTAFKAADLADKVSTLQSESEYSHIDGSRILEYQLGYLNLPNPRGTTADAELEANLAKNRYTDILPNDATRLKLTNPSRDYINGNWIKLNPNARNHGEGAYLATQGPLAHTGLIDPETKKVTEEKGKGCIEDHFRAISEQNCSKSVMLTNFVEKGTLKCAEYFPQEIGKTVTYGDITVQNIGAQDIPGGKKYTLQIYDKTTNVTHQHEIYHFTDWPDHGVPATPNQILDFRAEVNKTPTQGPLLVHCSAGVGRTGAYIAIDHECSKIENAARNGAAVGNVDIDVPKTVTAMRDARKGMVQSAEQYLFIHQAISQHVNGAPSPQPQPTKPTSNARQVSPTPQFMPPPPNNPQAPLYAAQSASPRQSTSFETALKAKLRESPDDKLRGLGRDYKTRTELAKALFGNLTPKDMQAIAEEKLLIVPDSKNKTVKLEPTGFGSRLFSRGQSIQVTEEQLNNLVILNSLRNTGLVSPMTTTEAENALANSPVGTHLMTVDAQQTGGVVISVKMPHGPARIKCRFNPKTESWSYKLPNENAPKEAKSIETISQNVQKYATDFKS